MRFYTTDEVAKELGVSKRTVERWASAGAIPCVRIKATVRIPETVIHSGSIIADGIIEEGSTKRTVLLHQLQAASYFLENAAEIFDQRVMDYLEAAVALDLLSGHALDIVVAKLHAFRKALREVWEAVGNAGPADIRLTDCERSRFASGSVA